MDSEEIESQELRPDGERYADEIRLPKGVNSIDMGGVVVVFLRDKIVFSPKGENEHLTFHFGPATGIFDVHRKTVVNGDVQYETLGRLPHELLPGLLTKLNDLMGPLLMSAVRPLSAELIRKCRVILLSGLFPRGQKAAEVMLRHKKRWALDEERLMEGVQVLRWPDVRKGLDPNESFVVAVKKNGKLKRIGTAFMAGVGCQQNIFWFSDRQLTACISRCEEIVMDFLLKARCADGALEAPVRGIS